MPCTNQLSSHYSDLLHNLIQIVCILQYRTLIVCIYGTENTIERTEKIFGAHQMNKMSIENTNITHSTSVAMIDRFFGPASQII